MPWYLGGGRSMMYSWDMAWGGLVPLVLWSVIWTGLALWHAAQRNEKWWFIFFLIVHTLGIIEILYLVFVVHAFGKRRGKRR